MISDNINRKSSEHILGVMYYDNEASALKAYGIQRKSINDARKFYKMGNGSGTDTTGAGRNASVHPGLQGVPCVYFLMDSGKDKVYVGMSKRGGLERLLEHDTSKDWWAEALILFNQSTLGQGRGCTTWLGVEVGYYEEGLWLEMDKDNYNVMNQAEPAPMLKTAYLRDMGSMDNQRDRLFEDIAIYMQHIGCGVLDGFLAKRHRAELERLDERNEGAGAGKGKADGGRRDEEEKIYNKLFAYVPTYYLPERYAEPMVGRIIDEKWEGLLKASGGDEGKAAEAMGKLKILDISCKGRPEFLHLLEGKLAEKMGRGIASKKDLYGTIYDKMLFGLALRPDMSYEMRERYNGKYDGERHNVAWLKEYKGLIQGEPGAVDKAAEKVLERLREMTGDMDMRFDIVIGNPPYQDVNKSIYPAFMELGAKVGKEVHMVTKNNWFYSDTLRDIRAKMVSMGLVRIDNYPVAHEVFRNVNVPVCTFSAREGHTGPTRVTEVRKGEGVSCELDLRGMPAIFTSPMQARIYGKVRRDLEKGDFGKHVKSGNVFGIESNYRVTVGDGKHRLWLEEKPGGEHNIELIGMDMQKQKEACYMRRCDVPRGRDMIGESKVICAKTLQKNKKVIYNGLRIGRNSIVTGSYGVLFAGSRQESIHVARYVCTRLFRMLAYLLCEDNAMRISPYRFSLVPDQDFTSHSDIDWSKTVPEIDAMLYCKYGLSDDEIAYINETIAFLECNV